MSNEKSLDCIGKCINTRDCGDCNDKDLYCEGITMYSEEAYMQIKQQLEKSEKINFELAASCCDRVLIGDGGHPYCDLKQQLADEKKKVEKLVELLKSPKSDMRFITVSEALNWRKSVEKTLKELENE